MKADNAIPTMSGLGPITTLANKVTTGTAVINGVSNSTELPNAPGVATALALFVTENGNLDANNKKKESLRQQLTQADADGVTIVRHWGLRRTGLLQAVNVFADGSKEKVQAFNLNVIERTEAPPATVPVNLRQVASKKPTTPTVAWTALKPGYGYLVQHATNPNDATTYAAPAMSKVARYALTGQALGAVLYFRVLALDPSLPGGQTAYSAWVTVTVGA